MSAAHDNAVLCAVADQDDATQQAFLDADHRVALALGYVDVFKRTHPDSDPVCALRQARTRIAADLMCAMLQNPNAQATMAGMAEWAVLGADILLDKLSSQRAMRVGGGASPTT